MAKRKELEAGQEWAYVDGRNDLHDDTCGYKCRILAPKVEYGSQNDVKVAYELWQFDEVHEKTRTIQLWQLKELWETFEPKQKQAIADEKVRWQQVQEYQEAKRIHEEKVAGPARQSLARLLTNVIGGYVSDWELGRCFDEKQVSELTAFLIKHGADNQKAAA